MKNTLKSLLILLIAIANYNTATAQNGYVKLFDDKTLKGWKAYGNIADFKVADGVIVGTTKGDAGGNYLVANKAYKDFVLELDVKIDGKLINSGIQIRSQFNADAKTHKEIATGKQCEIDPTDRRWTGGIYDGTRRGWLYPLDLNAGAKDAFKPGAYNHIKIECIGNETKTWVNGVATAYVVDTLDQNGFIGLQVHGKDNAAHAGHNVNFKNIKIKTAGLTPSPFAKDVYVRNLQPNILSESETQNGWKLLFDGKTSNGWRGAKRTDFPPKGWDTNGAISIVPPKKDAVFGGDIVTLDQYSAFDLSFEFKISPGANSGVKYFTTVDDKHGALGLEYQVLDDELHPDAKLGRFGNRKQASLYDLIPAKKPADIIKPVGEWNTGRVTVTPGNHVTHYLNGVKVLEYDRNSQAFKDSIAISKYKAYPGFGLAPKGYLLLQDHGGAVSFRSIKIKTL